jgi:hypothetical protein
MIAIEDEKDEQQKQQKQKGMEGSTATELVVVEGANAY